MESGKQRGGFTLIELSIVLVIIGLIVGGVLVGQDLIRAAAVRAQISQIEKYNTAVNTFRGKYGYIPGDIKDPEASNFGFAARGQYAGEGDGNGVIEGVTADAASSNSGYFQWGEPLLFWLDLGAARLIDGSFTNMPFGSGWHDAKLVADPGNGYVALSTLFPEAKIGPGNFIYVYSGSTTVNLATGTDQNGLNYFSLATVKGIGDACPGCMYSVPSLTVAQARSIDVKTDDGLPQSGRVTPVFISFNQPIWAGASTGHPTNLPTTSATPGSATTCYDNNNTAGATQQYSVKQNNGAGVNCALSFQFQ